MRSDEKTKMNDVKTRSTKPSAHQERIAATVAEARTKAAAKEEARKVANAAFATYAASLNDSEVSTSEEWSDEEVDPKAEKLKAASKAVKKQAAQLMKKRRSDKAVSYDW